MRFTSGWRDKRWICIFQIFPRHLLRWNIDGSKKNPLALLFASFNLSKCIFSGFVEYLCNTAIFTRFALKYLKPEDIEKQTHWPI